MSEPIVFVSTHRVREGKLEDLKQMFQEATPSLEAGKPQTVFFQAYLNEEGSEVTFFHVFPDAEGMDLHFQGADERSAKAYEFIQPERFEIYGGPSDHVLTMMRQAEGPELILKPHQLGGFIRLTPG